MEVSTVVRRAEYRIDLCRDDVVRYPTKFLVFEPDGPTFGNGSPRSTIEVDVYPPHRAFGGVEGARVGWPSTSDKRPLVARALAEALTLAAAEADRLDGTAYLMDDSHDDEIREGALVFLVADEPDGGDLTDDIRAWTIVDELGTVAMVPAGSLAKAVS